MITFIIPLKSSRVSGSWPLVCKLFERTLRSVCNQTSDNYNVVVVCHEKPEINFKSSKVTYLQVKLPLPGAEYASKEKDKMLKMQAGLIHAKDIGASYVMFVDADDCISNKIAEFVDKNPNQNGWYIGKGFDYQENIGRLKSRSKNLHLRTNSSHIINIGLLEAEIQLKPEEVKRGDCVLYHIDTASILEKRNTPLSLLPFKGVIYITDNGENMWWSQDKMKAQKINPIAFVQALMKKTYQKAITQPVKNSVREEFYLRDI